MTQVRFTALGDIADVSAGNPAPQNTADFSEDGEPFVRMQDVGRDHHTRALSQTTDKVTAEAIRAHRLRRFPVGTLLIPKSGASINLNHRALLGRDAYVVSHLATVVPDTSIIDPDFLYFWSLTYDPRSQAQTTSLPSLPTSLIKAAQIALPSLAEQRRIVDVLARAEGIVRRSQQAQQKAAELIPTLFLDLFGDPATNPKHWPLVAFGKLGRLDRGKSRHRPRDAQELYGGPYPFIQTGDVANSGGHITHYAQTYSELGLAQSRLWPAGTLCITIAANIARTGVLDFDACFPDSVVGFTSSSSVTVEYIQHWLGFLQPTLERNAPQAAQKNINLEILRNLPVPIPPIDLQRHFAAKAEAVRSIAARQSAALATAQSTFDALLHRAFSPDSSYFLP